MSEHPLLDQIYERMKAGKREPADFADLYTKQTESIGQYILYRRRQYFINQVKKPLMEGLEKFHKATSWWSKIRVIPQIVKSIRRYPTPTFENTNCANTHPTLKIIEKFNTYHHNSMRQPLFDAIFKIAVCEFEHDIYYADLRDWWVEQIILAILDGEWQPRLENHPDPRWWREPKPYGGKHSIVYKMWKHRKEIQRILAD